MEDQNGMQLSCMKACRQYDIHLKIFNLKKKNALKQRNAMEMQEAGKNQQALKITIHTTTGFLSVISVILT